MRIAIAGAGNVGKSIATELVVSGHEVLLIDKDPSAITRDSVPDAEWLLADACEMSALEEAELDSYDVTIAATGDDKANLVHSLLAKTEFGVPRTVGRVNHPKNEWLFDEVWGVDVAVSTPRLLAALVEEAVSVGDLVRLFSFAGGTSLVEMTLPPQSPVLGRRIGDLQWPTGAVLVAVIRGGVGQAPDLDDTLTDGDEVLFVITEDVEQEVTSMLSPQGNVVVPPETPATPLGSGTVAVQEEPAEGTVERWD
ncbi:potassium channel family protein [Enemella sp. A6]|uniref:potassium channel family protein n=1 Tax=Enemella sp. A6 TaxID=3440152 RepID=UPI003EBBFF47